MNVSVVIPTLNEEHYIPKCLESIRNQTVQAEIIVVDSGSTDDTIKVASKSADKILSGKKNIPYNRQIGAEESSGEIIVTTDADCIFETTWLERILEHFKDEEVVCISGPTIPIPGESNTLDRLCYWIGNETVRLCNNIWGKAIFRGSNTAYRKSVFKKVEGYNTKIAAREDSELTLRMSPHGKTIFDKKIVVKTSMRRRKNLGWIKTIRYYIDTPISMITGRQYYER